jgi:hypothetical protein
VKGGNGSHLWQTPHPGFQGKLPIRPLQTISSPDIPPFSPLSEKNKNKIFGYKGGEKKKNAIYEIRLHFTKIKRGIYLFEFIG